jgi:23S rRNA (cytosine1962-C5)-methyltransferase
MEAKIYLKSKKDQSLMRRHPWVFSGAIKSVEGELVDGDIVSVHANKGRFLGRGMFSTGGSIAVRLLTFEDEEVDTSLFIHRLERAWETRKNLGLVDAKDTQIFRLCHAEGDQLPGCIIDIYGDNAVFQAHAIGIYIHREAIAEAILKVSEGRIKYVYDRSAETLSKEYRDQVENGFIGDEGPASGKFLEHGHTFSVNWVQGQKTGFFIDQRENRRILGEISKGKKVLNTFCYTGGFSVYAAKGGATVIDSLDSSQKALDLAQENIDINGITKGHRCIKADAVEYLKELPEDYDIIVLDPPAFAKGIHSRHNAIQGYKRLNGHAIRQIKPGGLIMTFSCSQVITPQIFRDTILAAAINEGRNIRIVGQLHQPSDHPINIFHPEGEYLKGLLLEVE